MLNENRLRSKADVRKEIQELLDDPERPYRGKDGKMYKGKLSLIGKKHTLTRMIHQAEEYYEKVAEARKRPVHARYYLGDYITFIIVRNAKTDVEVMKEMRAELDFQKERQL